MDDSDKSLKFDISPDKTVSADKKAVRASRIEGRTVLTRRVDVAKAPPVKFNLDTKKLPKKRTRSQLAQEMAKRDGPPIEEKSPIEKISFIRRGVAFLLDCGLFLVIALTVFALHQDKLITYHLETMSSLADSWRVYSDIIYMIQIFVPIYLFVFFLPVLFLEGSFGKRLVGYKITQSSGKKANFDQLILRELFKILSLISIAGILMGIMSPYQTLHDRLSRTKLIAV